MISLESYLWESKQGKYVALFAHVGKHCVNLYIPLYFDWPSLGYRRYRHHS